MKSSKPKGAPRRVLPTATPKISAGVYHNVSRTDASSMFMVYGVKLSQKKGYEYIQFYTRRPDAKQSVFAKRMSQELWSHDIPYCNGKYVAESSECSPLAPFDNHLSLIVNIATGGWGAKGGKFDEKAFLKGVELEVSLIRIYYLQ